MSRARPPAPARSSVPGPAPRNRLVRGFIVLLCLLVVAVIPSGARGATAGAMPEGPPAAVDGGNSSGELSITDVRVSLSIYRGGDRLPDGEKVPRRRGVVKGVVEYRLSRPARAGESVHLLNFAEALAKKDPRLEALTALETSAYLDGPYTGGVLDVARDGPTGVSGVRSIRRVGDRRDVMVRVEAGADRVRLRYTVRVPRRYWPFGCSRRRCSLGGAVAPLPSAPVQGGRRADPAGRVVAPARWVVERVEFAAVPGWRPGAPPTEAQEKALRGYEIIVADRAAAGGGAVAYPGVFWGPKWRHVIARHRGVTVEVLHTLWRPREYPDERRGQLYRDVAGHLESIARRVVAVAKASGLAVEPGARLVVVQGPLRSSVAGFEPTAAVISDQMMQLVPGGRFMQFHRVAAARAMFDTMAHGHFAGRLGDPSTELWTAGAGAMALVDVWGLGEKYGDAYARDILGKFAFVPAVDNFLYTGQATFSDTYFRGSEDRMPLRNHGLFFAHDLPTGRRIHEKLRDLLGPQKLLEFYRLALPGDREPRQAAEHAYGYRLDWFFDQWLGRYPDVDYSVTAVEEKRLAKDRWRYRVEITRAGDEPVVEPVQVLVTPREGEPLYLSWNGDDGHARSLDEQPATLRHDWTFETDARVKRVEVDPRFRLRETPLPPKDNVDPLLNNSTPTQARFLYTGFGFDVAISEFLQAKTTAARLGAIAFHVFFEGSRQRDVRHSGHLQVFSDRNTSIGVGGGVNLWLGPRVNRLRRRTRVRLFTDVALLTDRGLDPRGGVRIGQSAAIVDDTRGFRRWPDKGQRLALALRASQVFRLPGTGQDDHRYSLSVTGIWVRLWKLAHQHVLATRLQGAVMLPIASRPEYRNLLRVGGIGNLDAYNGAELHSRAYLMANVEYRHVFFNNLDINVFHGAWLRNIGGVLYTGAASISRCDDYGGMFARESWYGQVGYGLVGYSYLLGVTPQLVKLDVSVPLVRRHMHCLGNVFPNYLAEFQGAADASEILAPVNVNLTFVQPF